MNSNRVDPGSSSDAACLSCCATLSAALLPLLHGSCKVCFAVLASLPPYLPPTPCIKLAASVFVSPVPCPHHYHYQVCLSLLGTWTGPSWEPGVSTLLQVLISLQSMVFVPDPYFNEPGYERSASTAAGKQASAEYNAQIRLGTATNALLPALERPDAVFKEALRTHYTHQAMRVRQLLQQWLRDTKQDSKQQLQHVVELVERQLDKLQPPPPPPRAPPAAAAAGGTTQQQQPSGRHRQDRRQQLQPQAGARLAAPAAAAVVDVVDLT